MVDIHKINGAVEISSTLQTGPTSQAAAMTPEGYLTASRLSLEIGTMTSPPGGAPVDKALSPMTRVDPDPTAGILRSLYAPVEVYGSNLRGIVGTIINVGVQTLTIQHDTPDVLPTNYYKIMTHTGANFVLSPRKSVTLFYDSYDAVFRIIGVT